MSSIEEIARGYWQAEESRNVDAIAQFFTDDARWQGPGHLLNGRTQIRGFYERSAARFPRLKVSVGRVFGDEVEAAIEWDAVFHDASDRAYALRGVNVMRTDGQRISSLITYNDPSSLEPGRHPGQVDGGRRFCGYRVLVTGAGSGIGAATARLFLNEGALVTGVDVNGESLERQRQAFGAPAEFQTIVADVTDPEAQRRVVEIAAGGERGLDVLVNNAAVFLLAGAGASDHEWRRTLEVNVMAPAQLVSVAADALSRSGRAAVVNVASISGHVSQGKRWTYNASKGAVLELTRCQALDLAPIGIRVNSVSPGYIWTEILERGSGFNRAKWEPIWGSYCPLNRCGEPSEVAAAIAYLASDAASFVTGTDLLVDGGLVSMSPDGKAFYEFSS